MEFEDIVITLALVWLAYRILKLWMVATVIGKIPIEFIFPIKIEHTHDQWFAWDKENEFLGQAHSKEELIDRLSKDLDFPKDKFTIISETIIKPPKEGTYVK